MSYFLRHAIVVTGDNSNNSQHIKSAHSKAKEIFPWVSAICPPQMNGERSFFIPPDGSKEGWNDSNNGDDRRDIFVNWLNVNNNVYWVEVCYAGDDLDARIIRSSDY